MLVSGGKWNNPKDSALMFFFFLQALPTHRRNLALDAKRHYVIWAEGWKKRRSREFSGVRALAWMQLLYCVRTSVLLRVLVFLPPCFSSENLHLKESRVPEYLFVFIKHQKKNLTWARPKNDPDKYDLESRQRERNGKGGSRRKAWTFQRRIWSSIQGP